MGLTPVLSLPYPEPGDTADVPRDMHALALAIEAQGVLPAGVLQMWPGTNAPTGWAICNGTTVDAAANPKLVALLGSAGGVVTLPNLKQRFPAGADVGDMALRVSGGVNLEYLTGDQMPDHAHRANSSNWFVPMASAAWVTSKFAKEFVSGDSGSPISVVSGGSSSFQQTGAQVTRTGGQLPHENRPQFYAVNFIIKLG